MRLDLLSEWHQNRNVDLNPENVLSGSNKNVWWICSQGHEWLAFCLIINYKEET